MTQLGPLRRRAWALGIGTILSLLAVPVSADLAPPAPAPEAAAPSLAESLTGEAKDDYESGKLLFTNGDHAGAALKFGHAYELSKDARLLWNIAAAEKHLRHYARVEALINEYLKASGPSLSEADKTNALDLLDTVKAFIAEVTLSANEPGAIVLIDDAEVGRTPLATSLRVDMGTRRVRVTKPGFREFTLTRTFAGGSHESVAVRLEQEMHLGRLRVSAGAGASIRIDGKLVGLGEWEGRLLSGSHRIDASAQGKKPWRSDAQVRDDQLTTVIVSLEDAEKAGLSAIPTWLYVAGGGVVAAGLGIGGYFLFKPEDKGPPPPLEGTFATVELPFRR